MNRLDFMKELERLLADISESEREEALQYYNDYLNDAGVENEEEVIASLGSPQKVAATIKAGLSGSEEGEFTENGYRDYEEEKKNTVALREEPKKRQESAGEQWNGSAYSGQYESRDSSSNEQQSAKEHEQQHTGQAAGRPAAKKKRTSGMLILLIILGIFFSPVLFGLGIAALGVIGGLLITIIAVLFSLLISAGVVALALLITGIILLGVAIAKLFVSPLGGITLLAAGMICAGIGLLFLALTVWVVGKLIPAVIRFIVDIFSGLFHKKGGVAA